jgi:hypothetical protein
VQCHTGRLLMFSVIINIYNKETKGPTSMELYTTTGKLKKFFDNYRCSMRVPRVTRHTLRGYSSFCYTRVDIVASIFFTAAFRQGSLQQ